MLLAFLPYLPYVKLHIFARLFALSLLTCQVDAQKSISTVLQGRQSKAGSWFWFRQQHKHASEAVETPCTSSLNIQKPMFSDLYTGRSYPTDFRMVCCTRACTARAPPRRRQLRTSRGRWGPCGRGCAGGWPRPPGCARPAAHLRAAGSAAARPASPQPRFSAGFCVFPRCAACALTVSCVPLAGAPRGSHAPQSWCAAGDR